MTPSTDLSFEDFFGCLIVRANGRSIVESKDTTFRIIADEAKARLPKAVLIDMRNIPGPITFMDRFQLGEFAGKHLAGFHLAALAHQEQTDEKRIGVLVARNRGARVESIFTDEAVALAWLKKCAAA